MCELGPNTIPVFLVADGEASWLLLPSSLSIIPGDTEQPENTYSCILKVTGHVENSKRRCEAGLCSKTSTLKGIFIVTPSLEG